MNLEELKNLDRKFRNQEWANEYIRIQIEQLFNKKEYGKPILYIELPIFLTPAIINKAIQQLGWHTIKMGDKRFSAVYEDYEKDGRYITLFVNGWDGYYEISKADGKEN